MIMEFEFHTWRNILRFGHLDIIYFRAILDCYRENTFYETKLFLISLFMLPDYSFIVV